MLACSRRSCSGWERRAKNSSKEKGVKKGGSDRNSSCLRLSPKLRSFPHYLNACYQTFQDGKRRCRLWLTNKLCVFLSVERLWRLSVSGTLPSLVLNRIKNGGLEYVFRWFWSACTAIGGKHVAAVFLVWAHLVDILSYLQACNQQFYLFGRRETLYSLLLQNRYEFEVSDGKFLRVVKWKLRSPRRGTLNNKVPRFFPLAIVQNFNEMKS